VIGQDLRDDIGSERGIIPPAEQGESGRGGGARGGGGAAGRAKVSERERVGARRSERGGGGGGEGGGERVRSGKEGIGGEEGIEQLNRKRHNGPGWLWRRVIKWVPHSHTAA